MTKKKEKYEALFKSVHRLLKKHGIENQLHGIVFKNKTSALEAKGKDHECPPCPDGYECVTLVDPQTFKTKRVCIKKDEQAAGA